MHQRSFLILRTHIYWLFITCSVCTTCLAYFAFPTSTPQAQIIVNLLWRKPTSLRVSMSPWSHSCWWHFLRIILKILCETCTIAYRVTFFPWECVMIVRISFTLELPHILRLYKMSQWFFSFFSGYSQELFCAKFYLLFHDINFK